MGEFGRTPVINQVQGPRPLPQRLERRGGGRRDSWRPSDRPHEQRRHDGRRPPAERAEVLTTVCRALAVDPMKQNMSNVGRPIRLVNPDAQPIKELLS